MRRTAILTALAAVLMFLAASCTPAVESANLQTYTLPGSNGTADCQFQVQVGQDGGTAYMRVREFGWWWSPTGASKCGYIELQLWTSAGSVTCEWGDGKPYTGVDYACTGSRNGVVGGTWFSASRVGELQTAYVVLERSPDILDHIRVYP